LEWRNEPTQTAKGDFHMARTQTAPASPPKAPDFIAWHVATKGEKSYWNKVGASWMHKDKMGMTLQMDVLPINGRIVLRVPTDNTESSEGARS
jgi:hypothetical protein